MYRLMAAWKKHKRVTPDMLMDFLRAANILKDGFLFIWAMVRLATGKDYRKNQLPSPDKEPK